MTWTVECQPTTPGLEWARELVYGADSFASTTVNDVKAEIIKSVNSVVDELEISLSIIEAERQASGTDLLDPTVAHLRGRSLALGQMIRQLELRDADAPFRVVLMGRTMAGKSTLFEYLSKGSGARVGNGGQRFTRESCLRAAVDLGFEIVDTPGVGALDGEEDYLAAFDQVADADLILWVATSQATQEQTGRALERLADLGKPIVVVLNCLYNITHEIGLLDFLEEPQRAFGGDAEGNLAPIRRHLARAGGNYVSAIPIHAQAALMSTRGDLDATVSGTLRHNSQIDQLMDVLAAQSDLTAGQRRVVSIFNVVQSELLDLSSGLVDEIALVGRAHDAVVGARAAFAVRAARRLDDAEAELEGVLAGAVASRERWIEQVDVEKPAKELNKLWRDEVAGLEAEFETSVASVGVRLEADLALIASDVADDWARIEPRGFRDLGGHGVVWGNRAVKTGGKLAIGFAGLGAGALVGTVSVPVPILGTLLGAAAGFVVSYGSALLGADRLINWIADRSFRPATEVRERRRQTMREQMSPLLEDLRRHFRAWRAQERTSWNSAVERELSKQLQIGAALEQARLGLERLSKDEVEEGIDNLDLEMSRELLRLTGRVRGAEFATHATRWRGAGIAITFPGPVYSEFVLFPSAGVVGRVIPVWEGASPTVQALHIIRNLADRTFTVKHFGETSLVVNYPVLLPAGIREAWESLAFTHTGTHVRIDQGDQT
jgi:small GTP-binding protein